VEKTLYEGWNWRRGRGGGWLVRGKSQATLLLFFKAPGKHLALVRCPDLGLGDTV